MPQYSTATRRTFQPLFTKPGMYSIDDLLTIDEIAIKLRVPVKTVRDWVYKKIIPYTRIGRRLYFSQSVIEDLLARNEGKRLDQKFGGNRKSSQQKGDIQESEVIDE